MARARPLLGVLGAIVAISFAPVASAQAPAVPPGAVVQVADTPIALTTFEHWFGIAAASTRLGYDAPSRPPRFARCVSAKSKTKRGRTRTKASLRRECQREYEGLRDQVLQFLILERWVAGEAAERGVTISAAAQDKAFQKAKRDTFPKESDFRRFLRQSGMTEADARFQVAFNELYTELRRLAIAGAAPVTEAEIRAYYDDNRRQFDEPESRDVRAVLTRTRAGANAALRALQRGESWHSVARRYSIDQASKGNGGLIAAIAEGSQERAFDRALFRAPKGKLRGPVRVQFGYYVFEVLKIRPARPPKLERARPAIKEILTSERQQDADEAFNDDLRTTWKARTACAPGYVMEQCSGTPDPPSYDEG